MVTVVVPVLVGELRHAQSLGPSWGNLCPFSSLLSVCGVCWGCGGHGVRMQRLVLEEMSTLGSGLH